MAAPRAVRAATRPAHPYLAHWGLSEPPFLLAPDQRFVFERADHREGLARPPWGLTDNQESLLAHSDLVFVDPVSTGYSRAVTGGKPEDFHGYASDVETIGEVVRLWVTRNERWLSPKYLAGESYGTLRAAALAEHLQSRHGLYPNGLLLISSVLDMGTIRLALSGRRGAQARATVMEVPCDATNVPE